MMPYGDMMGAAPAGHGAQGNNVASVVLAALQSRQARKRSAATAVSPRASTDSQARMLRSLPVTFSGELRKQRRWRAAGWTRPKRFELKSRFLIAFKSTDTTAAERAVYRLGAPASVRIESKVAPSKHSVGGVVISVRPAGTKVPVRLLAASSEAAMEWVTALRQACRAVRGDDFERVAPLGSGAYGAVHMVRRVGSERLFALKEVPLHDEAAKEAGFGDASAAPAADLLQALAGSHADVAAAALPSDIRRSSFRHAVAERVALERVSAGGSPFVANLYYSFAEQGRLKYVTSLAAGGDLHDNITAQPMGRFSEEAVRHMAAELALAIGHVHSRGVVHRDIKPENIFLTSDGHVLLGDFGLAKAMGANDSSYSFCGTDRYMSPEMVLGVGHSRSLDWWQLGCIVFELLAGRPPFYSRNRERQSRQILAAAPTWPADVEVSEDAKDLVSKLLQRYPVDRLGSGDRDVRQVTEHAFFDSIDFDALPRREKAAPYVPPEEVTLAGKRPRGGKCPSCSGARGGAVAGAGAAGDSSSDDASSTTTSGAADAAACPCKGAGAASSVGSAPAILVGTKAEDDYAEHAAWDNDFAGFDYHASYADEMEAGLTFAELCSPTEAVTVDATPAVDVEAVDVDVVAGDDEAATATALAIKPVLDVATDPPAMAAQDADLDAISDLVLDRDTVGSVYGAGAMTPNAAATTAAKGHLDVSGACTPPASQSSSVSSSRSTMSVSSIAAAVKRVVVRLASHDNEPRSVVDAPDFANPAAAVHAESSASHGADEFDGTSEALLGKPALALELSEGSLRARCPSSVSAGRSVTAGTRPTARDTVSYAEGYRVSMFL